MNPLKLTPIPYSISPDPQPPLAFHMNPTRLSRMAGCEVVVSSQLSLRFPLSLSFAPKPIR